MCTTSLPFQPTLKRMHSLLSSVLEAMRLAQSILNHIENIQRRVEPSGPSTRPRGLSVAHRIISLEGDTVRYATSGLRNGCPCDTVRAFCKICYASHAENSKWKHIVLLFESLDFFWYNFLVYVIRIPEGQQSIKNCAEFGTHISSETDRW